MQHQIRTIAILATLSLTVSCSSPKKNYVHASDYPGSRFTAIDAVRHRMDPKGSWWGPWLTDVYYEGADEPAVFCGWVFGLSPTSEKVTVFFQPKQSTSRQSSCKEFVEVVDGYQQWTEHGPMTQEQQRSEAIAEAENHVYFVTGTITTVITKEQSTANGHANTVSIMVEPANSSRDAGWPNEYSFVACDGNQLPNVGERVRIEFTVPIVPMKVPCQRIRKIEVLRSADKAGTTSNGEQSTPRSPVLPPTLAGSSTQSGWVQFGTDATIDLLGTDAVDMSLQSARPMFHACTGRYQAGWSREAQETHCSVLLLVDPELPRQEGSVILLNWERPQRQTGSNVNLLDVAWQICLHYEVYCYIGHDHRVRHDPRFDLSTKSYRDYVESRAGSISHASQRNLDGGNAQVGNSGPSGSNNGQIFRVGGGVSSPRAVYTPDPEYSDEARSAKFQGTDVLWLVVGIDGKPRDIKVARSIGHGLDEKAIEAVRNWKFEPAMKDGVPVPVQINVEVSFRLY